MAIDSHPPIAQVADEGIACAWCGTCGAAEPVSGALLETERWFRCGYCYRRFSVEVRVRPILPSETQAEVDDWTQDAPPVQQRPHFGVAERMLGVDLRDWYLLMTVPERDRL